MADIRRFRRKPTVSAQITITAEVTDGRVDDTEFFAWITSALEKHYTFCGGFVGRTAENRICPPRLAWHGAKDTERG